MEHGPDGLDLPTFLKQNFDVQKAVHLCQEAHLGPLGGTLFRCVPCLLSTFSLPRGTCRLSSPLHQGGAVAW